MRSTHLWNFKHGIAFGMALAALLLCVSGNARAQGQPPATDPNAAQPPAPAPAPEAPPPAAEPAPAPEAAAPAEPPPAEQPAAEPPSGELTPEELAALQAAEAPKEETEEVALEAGSSESGSDEVAEEVVITGSRIARNKKEQFAQVAVVSAKEIKASGATTIDEVLNKLPSLTLQGMNRQNNNGGNGLAFIDLRNLGTSRTLVLIDGKRFVSSGEFGSGVDMNNIPVAMIERVEVLLDGASAIYGSDAIGGVVNIILKKDFQGVQVDVGGGLSTHGGDGQSFDASVTMGGKHKKGNAALNMTYTHQGEVEQKNRSWSKNPVMDEYYVRDENGVRHVVRDYGSFNTADGILSSWYDDYYSNNGNWESIYTPDYSDLNDSFKGTMYNFGKDQWLIGRMDRLSLTTLADYKLGSHATAYLEGTYTFRKSSNQMAPQPLGATTFYPDGPTIPITNPYLPANVVGTEGSYGNDQGFWFYRRMVEAGDRVFENEAHSFRFLLGLQGDFIKDRFGYDVYVSTSRSMNSYIMRNAIDLGRVIETLDPEACAQNPNCPGVGNYFGAGNLQSSVLDYIKYDELSTTTWNMIDTGLSLNSKLVKIPFGGWLGAVVGAEFRWEKGENLPEGMVTQGYSQSNFLDPTAGSYNAQEFFGELSIPILKNKPGFYALTADIAGRMSMYDTFGSEFTYRTGLSWAPIPDFTLRGVYSTAFRAPSISDLYGGSVDSYLEVNDPCNDWQSLDPASQVYQNCSAVLGGANYNQRSTQIRTNIGSNPNLEAETARTVNAGIVITPTFIPEAAGDLVLSTDFYWIRIDNAISSLDPQVIVDQCYSSPDMSSNYYCQYVGERSSIGDINGLYAFSLNVSQVKTYGLDLGASYMIPLPRALAINLGWDGNILLKATEYNEVVDETTDSEGTIGAADVTGGSYAKFRWIFNLGIGSEKWNITNRLRYIGGAELFGLKDMKSKLQDQLDEGTITQQEYDDSLPPTKGVDPIAYWDIYLAYYVQAWSFGLGVDNVLDTDPPFVLDANVNTNLQTYDFMGRYIHANVGYKW